MKKEPIYVDIGEYNFQIRPFNALDGGYVTLFITKKLLPMLKSMAAGSSEDGKEDEKKKAVDAVLDMNVDEVEGIKWEQLFAAIQPILQDIDRKDLNEFMELCLAQIDIRMKAGYIPLYRHGVFADDDIGCSTGICFRLCFEAIKPLVTDFFAENGLNLSHLFSATMSPSAQ